MEENRKSGRSWKRQNGENPERTIRVEYGGVMEGIEWVGNGEDRLNGRWKRQSGQKMERTERGAMEKKEWGEKSILQNGEGGGDLMDVDGKDRVGRRWKEQNKGADGEDRMGAEVVSRESMKDGGGMEGTEWAGDGGDRIEGRYCDQNIGEVEFTENKVGRG